VERSEGRACGCEAVCSLPSDERRDRVATIRREILPHVTRSETLADGVLLEFEHTPALERALEDLVAFERACCSGLAWGLHRAPVGVLRLTIGGIAPDADWLRRLGGASARAAPRRLARLLGSIGIGTGAAFLLLCVLPIAIAAAGGAALVAPLARLDDPRVLVGASAVLAASSWLWGRRPRA